MNVGGKTAPSTFRFANNLWFNSDDAKRSKRKLPTAEVDGIYGVDPKFKDAKKHDFTPQDEQSSKFGAHALPAEK